MTRFRLAAMVLVVVVLSSVSAVAQVIPPTSFQELRWRNVGPFRGGRTRPVAGVPGQPNILYIAQVNGGIWKSDDEGRTWNPIFDDQPTQSIGALAVAPSDPNVIYAGSGEGLHRPDLSVGDGIYKSTDAGKTWRHLGLTDAQQIAGLAIDPRNPNRLFAAVLGHPFGPNAERGIFRSTDGGATWQKVLFKDENTGGYDVEIDPSNPDIVYASLWESRLGPTEDNNEFQGTGGGLFKSIDGGTTWQQLKTGLPADLAQIDVAIAPSNPRRLYATIATTEPTEYMSGAGLGFFRSDDGGATWSRVTTDARPVMLIGGGDLPVPKVDPQNADVVYSASIVTVKSSDGGRTWMSLRGAPGGDDYQNLWISPKDSNFILLASDQGAIVTVNGGKTWTSWYNQPTAQLYHIGISPTFPYRICSGQQESGSVCTETRGESGEITFRDWKPVGTIEYGYVAPDPLDTDIIYGGGRSEVTRYRWSTGQVENVTPIPIARGYRTDRTEPLIFSPADPHILYYATNVLFKTTDAAKTWTTISPDLTREHPGTPATVGPFAAKNPKADAIRGAIYAVAPGARNVNVIWAGTDDGLLWVTRDGGGHWTNITPQVFRPWLKVTQISASHFDDDTAYASASGLRIDDQRPYVFRTRDGGKTWQSIANGLPNAPVNTVREDPVRKGLLFAGTERDVWVSFDDGDHWQSLQLNLPHSSMRDLMVYGKDLIVATHGRGFWILDDITALRQMTPEIARADAYLFQPGEAVRVRRSLNTDTPLPADEPAGENPPDGAIIDYYVGTRITGPVTLEIFDIGGRPVRRFTSTDQPWITDDELKRQTIPPYWVKMPETLRSGPGMHRWVWDLHYPTPMALEHQYPISAVPHRTPRLPLGADAMPGTYKVKLTAGGKIITAPLVVTLDPRIHMTNEENLAAFDAEMRVADMLTRSTRALLEARSADAQLEKIAKASPTAKKTVESFRNELTDIVSGPKEPEASAKAATAAAAQQPAKATEASTQKQAAPPDNPTLTRVQGDAVSLYESVSRADAPPTQAQVQAVDALGKQVDRIVARWEELRGTLLPPLNRELQPQHLGPVTPVAVEPRGEGGAHEK